MKKTITGIIGVAAIAALVGIACNDAGDSDSAGAKAFLDRYHGGDRPVEPVDSSCAGNTPASGCKDKDTAKTYTLTVSSNNASGGSGGGGVSRNPGKSPYNAGDTVTVKAEPDSGYRFTEWTGAVEDTTNPVTIIMDADKKLTANFVWQDTASPPPPPQIKYELTIGASGGGNVSLNPDLTDYEDGATVTATAEPYSGYMFTGWEGASTSKDTSVTIKMDGNKTLTAKFIRVYTVTFDANGATETAPTAMTADSGIGIKLPDSSNLTRSGHTFGGWNTKKDGDGDNYEAGSTYTPNGNITLYAKWTRLYVVRFNSQKDSTFDSAKVEYGKIVSVPANKPTLNGCNFGNWYKEITCENEWNFKNDTVKSDTTLYAKWTITHGNQTYRAVGIGNQIWMAENLKYDAYVSDGVTPPKCYDGVNDNCVKYGRLYTWDLANGVCPENWHLPSGIEWDTLTTFVGNEPAKVLKSASGWNNNGNGTNGYGFSALPGGGIKNDDSLYPDSLGYWWTNNGGNCGAYFRSMSSGSVSVVGGCVPKTNLYSVRCVRD